MPVPAPAGCWLAAGPGARVLLGTKRLGPRGDTAENGQLGALRMEPVGAPVELVDK